MRDPNNDRLCSQIESLEGQLQNLLMERKKKDAQIETLCRELNTKSEGLASLERKYQFVLTELSDLAEKKDELLDDKEYQEKELKQRSDLISLLQSQAEHASSTMN